MQNTITHYQCIQTAFEVQAQRQPDAIVLQCDDNQISYAELNRQANQLAQYLQQCHVGPEVCVAIYLERSLEMVICMLGILKAGGAYLLLALDTPPERLCFMLDDAQVAYILSHSDLREKLDTLYGAEKTSGTQQIIYLDQKQDEIKDARADNLLCRSSAENTAYITYTSGSTGQPKGALIPHRSIPGFIFGVKYACFDEQQIFLQYSSVSWDAMTLELWPALLVGGRCILFRHAAFSMEELATAITRYHVTILWLTASLFNLFIDNAPELLSSVRQILVGGEALSVPHVRRALAYFENTRIINGYGPSECTVFVCCYPIVDQIDERQISIPIGRPIGDRRVYLLDTDLNRVPRGIPGEIFIGGPALARGYLHQPALTAQSFVPHPFSQTPGERLYKTGDLARFRADGTLEFLGRADQQIKLRGFRIELREIEVALEQHPSVQQALVRVFQASNAEKVLVAYLLTPPPLALSLSELRAYLQRHLPDYMLPSAFVLLERFPLNANGKVNHAALPEPSFSLHDQERKGTRPRSPQEELVLEVWREVLQRADIGVHDQFFSLGGHSLLATQVISRLRRITGVEMPLRILFEAPTVAQQAHWLETRGEHLDRTTRPPLQPQPHGAFLPLSFAQQRIWFLHQMQPDSGFYNVPIVLRLHGSLRIDILRLSVTEIMRRHETLRTIFTMQNEKPVQQVLPDLAPEELWFDLSSIAREKQNDLLEQLLAHETQRPYNLLHELSIRMCLVKLAAEEHVLLLCLHHIAADGWSIGVLYQELSILYTAYLAGEASPLPPLPIQYRDYTLWQRQWLQGEVLEEQLAYWRIQLADLPRLELHTDAPRPVTQSYKGQHLFFRLPADLADRLKKVSQQQDVTLFMTLLAAFQTLLFRYSGQQDIAVGSPIANRTHDETDQLIGCFINLLVLRTQLSGELPFTVLLQHVRKTCLDAYAHQDIPFEKVVEVLQPERSLGHHPLFQVLFVLQNAPVPPLQLSDLTIETLEIENNNARFDLTLFVQRFDEDFCGWFEYNTDLYAEETIQRLLESFEYLLQGISAHPEQPIGALPLLSSAQVAQQLLTWNPPSQPSPEQDLAHFFEQQVRLHPDALALVCDQEQMSYLALDQRANQLAHWLQRQGVQAEVPVGICLERSNTLIWTLLALLKAGGAYVPLDSSYPVERLQWMIKDAHLGIVLTQRSALPPGLQARTQSLVYLEDLTQELRGLPVEAPLRNSDPANLAYIIYTSGSTGLPKGVAVEQRQIVNYTRAITEKLSLNSIQHFALVASIAADLGNTMLFPALCSGGCLHVISQQCVNDPDELSVYFKEHPVDSIKITPSHFSALLTSQEVEPLFPRRHLILGGEALPRIWASQLSAKAAEPFEIINHYGPTETTVGALTYRWLPATHPSTTTVPIGRPLSNVQAYILDERMQLVPIGGIGQLYIGGEGVTRGYLNQPAMTAEYFLPHPFSDRPGLRLYRTGDKACYLPEGDILFLGRYDQQVKIRGFRVELTEIAAVIQEHQAIQECAVILGTTDPSQQYLIAYIVIHPSAHLDMQEIRKYVRERLPEYMLPSTFVTLPALPLKPNGKVDERALPAPVVQHALPQVAMTEIEHTIAVVWREALQREVSSIDDNFFDLGGHSLLLISVRNKLRDLLHRDLSIIDMFKHSTIRTLATFLKQGTVEHPATFATGRGNEDQRARMRTRRENAQQRRLEHK